jgi:hypothetical protein
MRAIALLTLALSLTAGPAWAGPSTPPWGDLVSAGFWARKTFSDQNGSPVTVYFYYGAYTDAKQGDAIDLYLFEDATGSDGKPAKQARLAPYVGKASKPSTDDPDAYGSVTITLPGTPLSALWQQISHKFFQDSVYESVRVLSPDTGSGFSPAAAPATVFPKNGQPPEPKAPPLWKTALPDDASGTQRVARRFLFLEHELGEYPYYHEAGYALESVRSSDFHARWEYVAKDGEITFKKVEGPTMVQEAADRGDVAVVNKFAQGRRLRIMGNAETIFKRVQGNAKAAEFTKEEGDLLWALVGISGARDAFLSELQTALKAAKEDRAKFVAKYRTLLMAELKRHHDEAGALKSHEGMLSPSVHDDSVLGLQKRVAETIAGDEARLKANASDAGAGAKSAPTVAGKKPAKVKPKAQDDKSLEKVFGN